MNIQKRGGFIPYLLIIIGGLLFSQYSFGQCDLTPDDGQIGPVQVEIVEFLVTNVITTDMTCQVDYSLKYKVLSTSCTLFFLQGLATCDGGSQSTFNLDQSGTEVTETGSIFNAACTGSCALFINGGWGGSCPSTTVSFPGTNCISVPYGVVPLILNNFSTSLDEGQKKVHLAWQTLSEAGSSHFEIEHSTDGIKFYPIGNITNHGNTDFTNNYSFTHHTPIIGINYYRLKSVDVSQAFSYSPIVTATLDLPLISILPNPSFGNIRIESKALAHYPFTLFTIEGREVQTGILDGNGQYPMLIAHPGLYFLEVRSPAKSWMEKIIVN